MPENEMVFMNHSKMLPEVSIIILNWNGLNDTVECLESLKKIDYPHYRVILVDNGSEGDDVEVLREKYGDYIHIIENDRNYGFSEGNNIGMRYVLENYSPDFFLLLNNDTVVDPGFLSSLVEVAESDPEIGIVGPKICFYNEPNIIQSAGMQIDWWRGRILLDTSTQIDEGQCDETREVDWVVGCALLIKRNTVGEIGMLYAGYFSYVEEADWCARATRAGYIVTYIPTAQIWHKRKLPIDRIDGFQLYYLTRNRFLFMKRNSTKLQLISFFVYFFLRDFLLIPLRLIFRQKDPKLLRNFYKGTCDGIFLILKEHRSTG